MLQLPLACCLSVSDNDEYCTATVLHAHSANTMECQTIARGDGSARDAPRIIARRAHEAVLTGTQKCVMVTLELGACFGHSRALPSPIFPIYTHINDPQDNPFVSSIHLIRFPACSPTCSSWSSLTPTVSRRLPLPRLLGLPLSVPHPLRAKLRSRTWSCLVTVTGESSTCFLC